MPQARLIWLVGGLVLWAAIPILNIVGMRATSAIERLPANAPNVEFGPLEDVQLLGFFGSILAWFFLPLAIFFAGVHWERRRLMQDGH